MKKTILAVAAILAMGATQNLRADTNFQTSASITDFSNVSMGDLDFGPIDNSNTDLQSGFGYLSASSASFSVQSNASSGYVVTVKAQDTADINGVDGWIMREVGGADTLNFRLISNCGADGASTPPSPNVGPNNDPGGTPLVEDSSIASYNGQHLVTEIRSVCGYFLQNQLKAASAGTYTCGLKMVFTANQ